MEKSPPILSVMEDYMGHFPYGLNMRKYFNEISLHKNIDFFWYKEERDFFTKVAMRPLHTYFPNQWVRKQNLDFHRLRCQTSIAYTARRLIRRKLFQKKYSVLHLHTQVMGLYATDFMKKIPTVVGIDITSVQASKEFTDPLFEWTYKPNIWLDQKVFNAAKKIVSWSDYARSSVIENFNIDESKVVTIPSGVDITRIPFSDRSKKLSGNTSLYKILFVGGDFRRKGGKDLLDVFLTSFKDIAELHIVTQANVTCDHPNVHVYNSVSAYTPQWLDLYHQADVYVMPTYADAFATVFLEAMAAGLPVIATTLAQITEAVIDGETGFLVNPGDRLELTHKIRCLIENPSLGLEMGAKGRKIAEQKFDSNKNFQALESIFREVTLSNSN
jgi:glycosyltransferase involved in cell wall biosynthesis